MRWHPAAPVNVARISAAASELISSRPGLISQRSSGLLGSCWEIALVTWELQELRQRLVRSWPKNEPASREALRFRGMGTDRH